MLLDCEIKAGEIYVSDFKGIILPDDRKPQLFQMVQQPEEIRNAGMFGIERSTRNALYENIVTGELTDWGTHCFTTLERIKKQYANIDSITDKSRVEYVKEAYKVISDYESKISES